MDATLVLECARANGDIVSSRKGILDLRITVHGRAAHAGVEPEKGRSAILEAARIVRDLHALNGRWPGVTVNVGVIAGGTRPNVVAEHCSLEVDVRAVDARRSSRRPRQRSAGSQPTTVVPDTIVEFEPMARWWPMEKLARSGRLVDHAKAVAERPRFHDQRQRDRRRLRRQHDVRAWASRASTAWGRSAATITRRPSTSRSIRSCPGRRCSPGCCWPSRRDPEVLAWRDAPPGAAQA